MAAAAADCRPRSLPRRWPRRTLARGRVPCLSGRLRQAADPGDRVRNDADDRRDARPAAGGSARTERRAMSAVTIFGLCAAVAVGLGAYGLMHTRQQLRKDLRITVAGR